MSSIFANSLSASPGDNPPPGPDVAELNSLSIPPIDDAMLAGLPDGSRPEVLTWERAYMLALIRSRAARPARDGGLAVTLDPKALAEQAERYSVGDFARFRKDFFADRTGNGERGFRDPSGAVFDLLRRIQAVENARSSVAAHERLLVVSTGMAKAEVVPQAQFLADQADAALQQARRRYLDELAQYRDKLDELKVELGLSPHAPIGLDRGGLLGFRALFESVDRWYADPGRDLGRLQSLVVDQLPSLGDVMIAGRPALGAINQRKPVPLEDRLSAGARAAIKNRSDRDGAPAPEGADDALELRVRRRIRRLIETDQAYMIETTRFVLILRQKDHVQEQLIAPPQAGSHRLSAAITDLVGLQDQILESQDRLVSLWTSYQALRLALYRDLGTMPYDDWDSFYDQFAARRVDADQGPKAPQAPPPPGD